MDDIKIAVIGLGYVGLPLARLFSTKFTTVGFDMNQARVDALMTGHDATLEVDDCLLQEAIANGFKCTTDLEEIRDCNFYVVAVPTPVDDNNRPDLNPLWGASETVGKVISKGDIVVYESTVYPGVTEEECLPVVERVSGLKFNEDFFAGYSPERINPGDKEHTVEKIKKVTSGSTPKIADIVDSVYNAVLINGTHKAPSIKVAEASKIIENSQRDVNIAFMNELAKIFNAMGIDTHEKGVMVKDAKILLMGVTFKENCPDVRNTKIVDIYTTLQEYTNNVTVYDPWANADVVKHEYGIDITTELPIEKFDAVIMGVAHKQFLSLDVKSLVKEGGVIYDVKGLLPRDIVDGRL